MTTTTAAALAMAGQVARADVPITQDPDYPELIRDLAQVVHEQLVAVDIEPDRALAIAESAAELVRERFSGQLIYIAKGERLRQRLRRALLWAEFDGRNHAALARRHGLSVQQVYRQMAVARAEALAKTQRSLFEPGPAGGA